MSRKYLHREELIVLSNISMFMRERETETEREEHRIDRIKNVKSIRMSKSLTRYFHERPQVSNNTLEPVAAA